MREMEITLLWAEMAIEWKMQITHCNAQFKQNKLATGQPAVERGGAGCRQLLGYSDAFTVTDSFKCLQTDFSCVYLASSESLAKTKLLTSLSFCPEWTCS